MGQEEEVQQCSCSLSLDSLSNRFSFLITVIVLAIKIVAVVVVACSLPILVTLNGIILMQEGKKKEPLSTFSTNILATCLTR